MTLVIPARFNGPDGSGNGGYVAGVTAATLGEGPATVSLRLPPPLETALGVATADGRTVVSDGDATVVEATAAPDVEIPVVERVDLATARAASDAASGAVDDSPFPRCFVCGNAREPGDGLRLFAGPVGSGTVAGAWRVGDDLAGRAEIVWAALDCPGAWTAADRMPMVLGSITGRVTATPEPGEDCVVTARFLGSERRKVWTATTAYGADGRELGRAHATWIAL
ncbi:hypothetical protein GCM10023094_31790 [Rhodococcus olei]|uniref:Thioesterase superfamily protein n=1 Tax=Rhodococcus olei TaxID=2161675 RepID=A0ABP8P7Z9_9NOCA